MRILAASLFVLFFGIGTHAELAGQVSENYWQAGAGKHEGTFGLDYSTVNTEIKSGATNGKIEIKSTTLSAGYEYGLSDAWALGARLAYTSGKTDVSGTMFGSSSSSDETGLNDVEFTAKGNSSMGGSGSLHYGAILSLSPGDSEKKANGDENKYSGGHLITPYVAYLMKMDTCVLGLGLSREVFLGDRSIDDKGNTPNSTKESGGEETTISLIYEHTFSEQSLLAFGIDYLMTGESTEKYGSTTEKTKVMDPIYNLSLAYRHNFGGNYLIPRFTYSVTTDDKAKFANSDVDVDTFNRMDLALHYRMEF